MEFERYPSFSLFEVLDVVSFSSVCFAIIPIDKNINQRICLEFCIANRKKTHAYDLYSAFESSRDVVEDFFRSGRPSTSSTKLNIAKVKEMANENRH